LVLLKPSGGLFHLLGCKLFVTVKHLVFLMPCNLLCPVLTSVYCAEQKPVTWDELWLDEGKFYFQWDGAGPGASMRFGTTGKDFLSMQECNPLGKHVDAQFNYRYSKDHQAICVPCTYRDKKGKAKTSEARYTLTAW